MPYAEFIGPIRNSLHDLSSEQLEEYFHWFMTNRAERTEELASLVRISDNYALWRPDYSSKSLDALGRWLASVATVRPANEHELAKVRSRALFYSVTANLALTSSTFSIACDVGIYLGDVIVSNHSAVHWVQQLDNKRSADYGHAVLAGFDTGTMNPLRIAIVLAYALATGAHQADRLRELYEYWTARIR
jgi:hypothetical protein